jgi:TPR repeat protein
MGSPMSIMAAQNDDSHLDPRWTQAMARFDSGDMLGALFLYKALAADGDNYALVEVGNLYELGVVTVGADFEEAAKWYRKAVFEVGDPKANLALARMYFNRQLKADNALAVFERHAIDAAERGESLGWLMLGLAYEGNRFGTPDRQRAIEYYKRASSAGLVLAERRLAGMAWHAQQFASAVHGFASSLWKTFRYSIRNPNDPRLIGLSKDSFDLVDLAKEPHNRSMQPTAGSGG